LGVELGQTGLAAVVEDQDGVYHVWQSGSVEFGGWSAFECRNQSTRNVCVPAKMPPIFLLSEVLLINFETI
jgi:hypothetical protein